MQIVVSGPVAVTSFKTGMALSSPRKLRKLNKLVSEDSCTNYFEDELSDLDLQGGQVRLSFDTNTGKTMVITTYESATNWPNCCSPMEPTRTQSAGTAIIR